MSDDTQRIGNALIVNTHGLMKMRCRRPTSSRFVTRFSSGQGSRLGQRANPRRDRRVANERQPAAVAVERLERLEAEEAGVAERADGLAVPGRAERVRAVFDHAQLVARRDVEDGLHVARQAVQVRRHDGACRRRDGALERRGDSVNVPGSTSAKTTFRPATCASAGTTQNVSAGTTISEPAGRSSAFRM